jgi:predicted small lipoprotein YifL
VNGRALAPLLALATALAGCGLKGPLYLPEKSREVIIRPAPGAPAEAATPTEAPPAAEPAGETEAAPKAPADREAPPPGTAHG